MNRFHVMTRKDLVATRTNVAVEFRAILTAVSVVNDNYWIG